MGASFLPVRVEPCTSSISTVETGSCSRGGEGTAELDEEDDDAEGPPLGTPTVTFFLLVVEGLDDILANMSVNFFCLSTAAASCVVALYTAVLVAHLKVSSLSLTRFFAHCGSSTEGQGFFTCWFIAATDTPRSLPVTHLTPELTWYANDFLYSRSKPRPIILPVYNIPYVEVAYRWITHPLPEVPVTTVRGGRVSTRPTWS